MDYETAYVSAAYVTGPEAFGLRMDCEGKGIGAAYGARWLGARTCLGTKVRTLEFQTTERQALRMQNDLQDAGFDTVVRVFA